MADYSITGDTKLDTSGFTNGISGMTVAAGNLIADLVKTATSKLAGLATASVDAGASFEAAMSQVAATMGVATEDIQTLTDTAKELGRSTKFTASEAATALNYLALAGYDAEKAAEVLPSVLDLAAAGAMDLGYASDLVTDAMSALRIEATKANVDEFGDKLAMAASKANANVAQLGEAILTVGGTAANLKNGTTELTTALGLLANVGIKGAEGGTHLRNIILSLQSPVDDAAELMDALGLAVYDTQGNMRGLDEILTDLNTAMEGMTQGEKDSIINRIFNKTDLAAVNGLLEAQGEQWNSLAAYIDAADGSMSQMAQTQIDNMQGAKTIMESAKEGLQIAIFEQIEPMLTEAYQMGAEILTSLANAMEDGGPEAMLTAAGEILGDLMQGVTEALPGLVSTGIEVITALTEDLLAATPQLLETATELLGALAQGIIEALPSIARSATQIIFQLCEYLGDHAGDLWDTGLAFVEQIIIGINENLPDLLAAAAGLIARFVAATIEHLPEAIECGAALLTSIVDGIVLSIEHLGEAALACVAELLGVWDGSMDEWGHIGENIVQGLLDGILGIWDSLVTGIKSKVNGLVDTVKNVLGIHSPSTVFAEIGENICSGLVEGIEAGTADVEQAVEELAEAATDTAIATFSGLWSELETRADEGVLGTFDTLYSAVQQQDWAGIGKWMASTLYEGLSADRKEQIETFAFGIIDQLNGILGEAQTQLADAAWNIGESIYHGVTAEFGNILETTQALGNSLGDVFSSLKEPISTAAKAISEGLSGGLLSAFPSIYAAMGSLITSIGAAFEGMLAAISTALSATVFGVPMGVIVAGAAVALGVAIAAVVAKLSGKKGGSTSTGSGSSGSGSTGALPGGTSTSNPDTTLGGDEIELLPDTGELEDTIQDATDRIEDLVQDNTEALTKTNAALADMVRQANSLVLSDNMQLGSTVAASSTAQVRADAAQYHTNTTVINQTINSKAQTAADLARETRWEADKALAQKR